MNLRFRLLLPFILILAACGTSKKTQKDDTLSFHLDDIEISPKGEYQATATRVNDLLHTSLNVSFDFEKQQLKGNAVLTLKPYAKPVSSLELDAKGFDILKVEIFDGSNRTPLTYYYDSLKLKIDLRKTYTEKDTYTVQIDYIAKPNELAKGGSAAITSDKGLYFINPQGKEKNKPFQIWTQGETEASSCWFPTIDKPYEKTTQEIFITVPDTLVTLSNGILARSTKNADGTRTDYWKMEMPHAPYLFMMAVSDFAVVKDAWRNLEVNYYVEKQFEPYAKNIFGNTPEMMEFYSKLLNYDFPWQKYAQVTVRDYVSGAMENTTATVFFDNMQMTKRELIDKNFEDIIAHELFHQWFGDIVTCESWSNLSLNEGFATYGEYLWAEYKYGKDEAERQRADMLQQYLSEAWMYKRPIFDFHYDDKEDMFDSHSYSKGGLVLHMLRNYLGDAVFFKGLNHYLTKHAFKSVEVHDLRIALEEASGEDLNWFFNQWFLSPGHPELEVSYYYTEAEGTLSVTIEQVQESKSPVFRLPLAIDIYAGADLQKESVVLENKSHTFDFKTSKKPDLVNIDAEKNLLCEINDYKSVDEYAAQYDKAPGYRNKEEALTQLALQQDKPLANEKLIVALQDQFWALRKLAVEKINLTDETKPLLAKVADSDTHPQVRAAAIRRLNETASITYTELYKKALADSSIQVNADALDALYVIDSSAALAAAAQFEELNAIAIIASVGHIYASIGGEEKQSYFEEKVYAAVGYARFSVLSDYGDFLKVKNETIVRKGAATLEDIALNAGSSWERFVATNALYELRKDFDEKLESKAKSNEADAQVIPALIEELQTKLDKIIAAEKDASLLKRYGNFK
ncbi:MAG: M1 family metallopeptidase [Chitinophagales bacterium]|nr:M1 family metallopeptidase [Chitinophagales bacterium]